MGSIASHLYGDAYIVSQRSLGKHVSIFFIRTGELAKDKTEYALAQVNFIFQHIFTNG